MIIDSLCPPAVLYLGFSVIQIIIDLFRGQQNSAFLKVIVMIVFTILLNQLCIGGLTILSWFIVFIPFIMMTYVTTILLYVFGLNPSKGKSQPQPDPRRRHKPHPTPYNPQEVGGCAGTEFGCCPDGVTASNEFGSNCYGPGPGPGPQPAPPHHHHHHHHGHYYPPSPGPQPVPPGPQPVPPGPDPSPSRKNIGGCAGTEFGCCDDGTTSRTNKYGSNCHSVMPIPGPVGGCSVSEFGCCDNGITAANANKSNCHSIMPIPKKPIGGCAGTEFGCCSDGVTPKNKFGSNCHSVMPSCEISEGTLCPAFCNNSCTIKPNKTQIRYSCLPGMDASCKEDINGLYTSLADCEQKTKCSEQN